MPLVISYRLICWFCENSLQIPTGYKELLQELTARIRSAQLRASFAVSRELVLLYWSVGREILMRQKEQGWGAKVIERLAHDLQTKFQESRGIVRGASNT